MDWSSLRPDWRLPAGHFPQHHGDRIWSGRGGARSRSNNIHDFTRLINSIGEVRHAEGPRDHPLWRIHSERWLESLVVKNVGAIDERLSIDHLYSQVPAFSASDRAMIDVLASTREGRLAVVELKADEDIHLPLQGLDYWSRVTWHHSRGEFKKFGYFPGRRIGGTSTALVSGGASAPYSPYDGHAAPLYQFRN